MTNAPTDPHRKTCPCCDGDGSLMVDNYDVSTGSHRETCNTCEGDGTIEIDEMEEVE